MIFVLLSEIICPYLLYITNLCTDKYTFILKLTIIIGPGCLLHEPIILGRTVRAEVSTARVNVSLGRDPGQGVVGRRCLSTK